LVTANLRSFSVANDTDEIRRLVEYERALLLALAASEKPVDGPDETYDEANQLLQDLGVDVAAEALMRQIRERSRDRIAAGVRAYLKEYLRCLGRASSALQEARDALQQSVGMLDYSEDARDAIKVLGNTQRVVTDLTSVPNFISMFGLGMYRKPVQLLETYEAAYTVRELLSQHRVKAVLYHGALLCHHLGYYHMPPAGRTTEDTVVGLFRQHTLRRKAPFDPSTIELRPIGREQ
jgi:hypothetical protein